MTSPIPSLIGQIIIPLILPIVSLLGAFIFKKTVPKKINYWYGYRTKTSMRNQDTWNEANKYAAGIMAKSSLILLIVNLFWATLGVKSILWLFSSYTNFIFFLIFSSFISFLSILFLTEKRLRFLFDEAGNRK
ncbi:MAG: SdpI family protein [Spirosomataceae bacterium]